MLLAEISLRGGPEELCGFRVVDVAPAGDGAGRRWRLRLSDISATVTAFVDERSPAAWPSEEGAVCFGMVATRRLDGEVYASIGQCEWIDREIVQENGVTLLPRAWCPSGKQTALDRLLVQYTQLTVPTIRRFLDRVMCDSTLYPHLLSARASANHHHRDRGGLLEHSVAVAEICAGMAGGMPSLTRDICVVAGLLHDIGKIKTVGSGPRRPAMGKYVPHEALTLELLAPHLAWLDSEDHEHALMLRNALTWYLPKSQRFSDFVGADVVRAADQTNVACAMGKGGI